jgi:predicted ArsR family transcriptional regulator
VGVKSCLKKVRKINKLKMKPIYERNKERGRILEEFKAKEQMTVDELAESTHLQKWKILKHLIALRQLGRVTIVGERDNQFLYALTR